MNWFTSLFKSRPPAPELVHPQLGRMVQIKGPDGSAYWESEEDVHTAIGPIQTFIDGDENGPYEELVDLWSQMIANFDFWKNRAKPKLLERLQDFGYEDRYNELVIVSFGLYQPGSQSIDWDMSFELDARVSNYTVCFKDGEATIVTADS